MRKKRPEIGKNFSFRCDDCGGYFQVYYHDERCETKLGNIYPPGYVLFGEVQDKIYYVVEGVFGKGLSSDFQYAFQRLIEPILTARRELK